MLSEQLSDITLLIFHQSGNGWESLVEMIEANHF